MSAVALSLVSAASFGAMTVAIRIGLREGDAAVGALAILLWATAVVLAAAAPRHDVHGAWPFLLAGILAPGCSQVLFTRSVQEAGPARTSIVVGAAPLVTVALALVFLDEPVNGPLLVGALAIVAGGFVLARERERPDHVRPLALLLAVGAAVFFAVRDNLVRALHTHANPETAVAATMVAGLLVTLVWARRPPRSAELIRLAPAGLLFGLSYVCLFEAYFRGRVSVVSPLVATESLWGVCCAAVFLRTEGVGPRLVVGAVLVAGGAALIGVFR
jgi:drug/metabolite transporter (DMT)-like permease